MNKTVTITAAIVGASALVADLIFSAKTFFRHKKMLIELCKENAELLTANTHLQAEAALARSSESKNVVRAIGLEQELETVRAANLIVSQDLDAARAENSKLQDTVQQLKLKLAASENKFKQAAEHINVLRIDLNRKNNRRKK